MSILDKIHLYGFSETNNRELIKLSVEAEERKHKMKIFFAELGFFLLAGAIGALSIMWMVNEIKIQKAYEEMCSSEGGCGEDGDIRLYDVLFEDGYTWTDRDKAAELIDDLNDDCDEDCLKAGCRWSIVYTLNAVTAVLYAISHIILMVGTWYYHFRIAGILCQLLLILLSIATITTTAVFRFNKRG